MSRLEIASRLAAAVFCAGAGLMYAVGAWNLWLFRFDTLAGLAFLALAGQIWAVILFWPWPLRRRGAAAPPLPGLTK